MADNAHDRPFAEVGRQMARWLATNDPHATPLTDAVGWSVQPGADAARLEAALRDNLLAHTRGFVAGWNFARENPELMRRADDSPK